MRSHGKLLSVLGVTFGLAVTIGNVIGAGILRTPGDIARLLPTFSAYLAVWVIGGAYALLGANAIAELGAMTPRSGGQYVFVRRALGDYPGFVVGWSDWLSTCGTTAAVSIVFGEYAAVLMGIAPRWSAVLGVGAIILLTLVQWVGVKAGARAQDVTSFVKALVLLLLVGACFVLGRHDVAAPSHALSGGTSLLVAFVLALQAVIYTYDGWTAVVYFSEEVKDPGRDIPRSMFGGLIGVIALYLLINVAFLRVVPMEAIAGQDLAAAAVARTMFGARGDLVIRSILALALVSALNSNVLMAPRVLFAMARDGLFWRGATRVNAGGTPDVAMLVSSILGIAFIASGTFESVIAKLAFFFVANYALSFASLFVLRRREPEAPRPYRAIGHPFTTALALIASLVFLVGAAVSDSRNSAWAIGLLVVTIPVYRLVRSGSSS